MAWTAPRTWLAGEVVTAAHMNTHVRDNLVTGFTSALFDNTTWKCQIDTTGSTGPNDQSIAGSYVRTGAAVNAWGRVLFNSPTTYGSAGCNYYVAPPKPCASYLPTGSQAGATVGSGFFFDNSANDTYILAVIAYTTNQFAFRFNSVGTTDLGLVNSTNPVTVSTADRFSFHLAYPTTST